MAQLLGHTVSEKCKECGGTGVVTSDAWAAWHAAYAALRDSEPDLVKNTPCDSLIALGHLSPYPSGPEEPQCGICKGRGVALTDTGERIIDFVRTWL